MTPTPETAARMTAGKRNRRGFEMGMSLELAEDIFWWANWILVGALVVGVLATYAIVVSGNIRDSNLKRELNVSRERIAQLNNETARLLAREPLVNDALLASAQSAKAQAVASQFLLKLTQELAHLMPLAAMQLPGFLSFEQHTQIISKVKPFAGKQFDEDIDITSNDIERVALLGSLENALEKAGWVKVVRREQYGDHASVRGVTIEVDTSKDSELLDTAETLASALNAEGIAATVNPKTETDTTNVIHILVGPKP